MKPKPFYKSKKFWTAVVTIVGAVVLHFTGNEALAELVAMVGGTLIVGFGIADNGKEAAALRGKLPGLLLVVALAFPLQGCAALSTALGALEAFSSTAHHAQRIGSALDAADAGAKVYFARHPSLEAQQKVAMALKAARSALVAYDAAAQAAGGASGGDLEQARTEALRAYGELWDLLSRLGVLEGRSVGGADADAPEPGPLVLPTVAELEA